MTPQSRAEALAFADEIMTDKHSDTYRAMNTHALVLAECLRESEAEAQKWERREAGVASVMLDQIEEIAALEIQVESLARLLHPYRSPSLSEKVVGGVKIKSLAGA